MQENKAPFQSFVFSLTNRSSGRILFSLVQQPDESFELHVEKGPSGGLSTDFTRSVPLKTAQALRDACAEIGVFGWDDTYPDDANPGSCCWSLRIVFQEGVYTQECTGGSSTPEGFDALLEQFYQLDLPRPGADDAPMLGAASASLEGLGSLGSLFADTGAGGPDVQMLAAMQEAMAELQNNPQLFQQQMKEEFRQLPPEQQNQMLDMLSATGFASREWWENFLRG